MTSRPSPASRRHMEKPWQRRRPRPYRREIPLLDEPPLAQICVYDDAIILTRRDRRTHAWTSYGVSESALRAAFVDETHSSGYLPPSTVAIGHLYDAPWLLVAVPPRAIVLVNRMGGSDQRFAFITPALMLAGWKHLRPVCDGDGGLSDARHGPVSRAVSELLPRWPHVLGVGDATSGTARDDATGTAAVF